MIGRKVSIPAGITTPGSPTLQSGSIRLSVAGDWANFPFRADAGEAQTIGAGLRQESYPQP